MLREAMATVVTTGFSLIVFGVFSERKSYPLSKILLSWLLDTGRLSLN
ncbi:hypothetical protein AB751O23_AA_00050 [Chlamydiales bacterium SCGC AB-751-O23]|nr:hypothetical protein AB751O23_AA_00050 [Chlamydiales bacterium SCGC AB-751-O23]